nr:MAG: hypothetical protein [brine shrimp yue-like virus 2]UNI74150.1 MAG: hypothetical protein [brine shrimp yue-like virus 2]UNI74152.1 MAG: hypothetical protein [brine shrimp yue-like virus 2]
METERKIKITNREKRLGKAQDARPTPNSLEARMIEFFKDKKRTGVGQELDFKIGHDISAMINDAGIDIDDKGVASAALLYALFQLNLSDIKVQSNNFSRAQYKGPSATDPATKVVYDSDNVDAIPNNDHGSWFKKFLVATEPARGWLIDLTACHQIKPLDAANIEHFFAGLNGTKVSANFILLIIRVAAGHLPKVMENPYLRDLVVDSDFIEYHTSAASTAKLAEKVMGELGLIRRLFISDRERDIVLEAVEDRWSISAQNAIPMEVRGVTRAYLDALNLLPDNWYQGFKILNAIPLMRYRSWVSFFKKYAAFSSSTSMIDSARDMKQLLEGVPRTIFRTSGSKGGDGGGNGLPGDESDGVNYLSVPTLPTAAQEGEGGSIPSTSGSQRGLIADPDVVMKEILEGGPTEGDRETEDLLKELLAGEETLLGSDGGESDDSTTSRSSKRRMSSTPKEVRGKRKKGE